MGKPLSTLFWVFAPLSLGSIGGGQAIIADVQRQVVQVNHWLTAPQFNDFYAISRMTPGPGTLLVTLIGWHVAGPAGAVVATIAIFCPAIFLTYFLARLWSRFRGARWQRSLELGMRPVASGMILASVFVLIENLSGGWLAQGVALASTGILLTTRVNPLLLLTAGAGLFVAAHAAMPSLM